MCEGPRPADELVGRLPGREPGFLLEGQAANGEAPGLAEKGKVAARGGPVPPSGDEARRALAEAYALLSRRSLSRRALRDRLLRDHPPDAVEAVLGWLEARRLLDDRRMADEAVRTATTRRGWGRRKVAQWMQGRGIDADAAHEALAELDPDEEAAQASALAARQRDRGKSPEQVFRFLVARGYPTGVARRAALDSRPSDEP
jgi:regulatory protein